MTLNDYYSKLYPNVYKPQKLSSLTFNKIVLNSNKLMRKNPIYDYSLDKFSLKRV